MCQHCLNRLPQIVSPCYCCGLACYAADPTTRCGACQQHPPVFERCIALYPYASPITTYLSQLKFYHKLVFTKLFGQLFTQKIQREVAKGYVLPECIIAVPLHRTRLRYRGFNQAHELAKMMASQLEIPLASRAVIRQRATETQLGLSRRERKRNVRGAFKLIKPIAYRHVAIVDDVVTSGATASALVVCLQQAGVQRIDVWCIARTH